MTFLSSSRLIATPPACPAAEGGTTRTRPGGRKTTVESEIISGIQRIGKDGKRERTICKATLAKDFIETCPFILLPVTHGIWGGEGAWPDDRQPTQQVTGVAPLSSLPSSFSLFRNLCIKELAVLGLPHTLDCL
jgi:hypothetical protein